MNNCILYLNSQVKIVTNEEQILRDYKHTKKRKKERKNHFKVISKRKKNLWTLPSHLPSSILILFKGENGPMPISFSLPFSLKGLSILKIGMEMCISVK